MSLRGINIVLVAALMTQMAGCYSAPIRKQIAAEAIAEKPGERKELITLTLKPESDYPPAWKKKGLKCRLFKVTDAGIVVQHPEATVGSATIELSDIQEVVLYAEGKASPSTAAQVGVDEITGAPGWRNEFIGLTLKPGSPYASPWKEKELKCSITAVTQDGIVVQHPVGVIGTAEVKYADIEEIVIYNKKLDGEVTLLAGMATAAALILLALAAIAASFSSGR